MVGWAVQGDSSVRVSVPLTGQSAGTATRILGLASSTLNLGQRARDRADGLAKCVHDQRQAVPDARLG